MSNPDDSVFSRNSSLVLVGLLVVGVTAFALFKFVNHDLQQTDEGSGQMAVNVSPVGEVNTGSEAVMVAGMQTAAEPVAAGAATAATGASSDPGKATYDKACFACHAQGIAGAPKYGDVAAWESRVAQGRDTLLQHALDGFTGQTGVMPARGGNPTLGDAEIGAALDYMLAAVGSGGSAATAAVPVAAAAAPATAAVTAGTPVAANDKGKQTYDMVCFVCHTPGAAGAPKLGDAAAWSPRIEKGLDVLYHSSLNGFMGTTGMMPPKGGRPDIADDDVKAAVDYMVSNSK